MPRPRSNIQVYERACIVCGVLFTPQRHRAWATHCSQACTKATFRQRRDEDFRLATAMREAHQRGDE